MLCGQDPPDHNGVIARVMASLAATFKARGNAGQRGHAIGIRGPLHLVKRRNRPGEGLTDRQLILSEHMDGEPLDRRE